MWFFFGCGRKKSRWLRAEKKSVAVGLWLLLHSTFMTSELLKRFEVADGSASLQTLLDDAAAGRASAFDLVAAPPAVQPRRRRPAPPA